MKKSVLICFLIALLYLVGVASAVDIFIYREAPTQMKLNNIVQINITIENKASVEKNITIKELFGDFEAISPQPIIPQGTQGMIGVEPPYYEWNFVLKPSSNKTIDYIVKFTKIGDVILSPTSVYVDNEIVYNEIQIVKVSCNKNSLCESSLNENYFTCVEDCPSGSFDGVCDLIDDGICDKDCVDDADIDCKEQKEEKCGNGICNANENYSNCKADCHGLADNYCDKAIDEVCDPDCIAKEDQDCLKKQNETKKIVLYFVALACLIILVFALYKLYQKIRWRKLEKKYQK